ncbi:MAG: hypothetical protein U0K87_15175, partial [Ruminococcus sp.]|nr:hypothetical protein [Ruminococcus sp.]
VGKSKSLDFPTMLIFWSLVRNSVVLAVYLLFSVACFLTVHEHLAIACHFSHSVLFGFTPTIDKEPLLHLHAQIRVRNYRITV